MTNAEEMKDLDPEPALRIIEGPSQRKTLEGRCVGVLFADGSDAAEIDIMKDAFVAAKGKPALIALEVGGAKLKGGKRMPQSSNSRWKRSDNSRRLARPRESGIAQQGWC